MHFPELGKSVGKFAMMPCLLLLLLVKASRLLHQFGNWMIDWLMMDQTISGCTPYNGPTNFTFCSTLESLSVCYHIACSSSRQQKVTSCASAKIIFLFVFYFMTLGSHRNFLIKIGPLTQFGFWAWRTLYRPRRPKPLFDTNWNFVVFGSRTIFLNSMQLQP